MKSMTGFGTSQLRSKELELDITIRAVNGRFFDPRFHIPREYQSLEAQLKQTLHQHMRRGTVDIYISRRPGADAESYRISVNTALAKRWHKAYQDLAKSLKTMGEASLETIAGLPDVMRVSEDRQVPEKEQEKLLQHFEKAVRSCLKERQREGQSLKKDLTELIKELENLVKAMAQSREQANVQIRKRFHERMEKMQEMEGVDPQRLAQEVAIYLDRMDVNEELHRLREHIKSFKALLKDSHVEGKKMDFYCQELLREVNTVGSKSQVAELTGQVVDAKSIVEKLREQVQNVE